MGQVSKLNYVNAKLGSSASRGQQTTRVIYDTNVQTANAVGVAAQKYYEFFQSGANKGILDTNLNTGKLDSMESMVIKEIQFNVIYQQSGTVYWNQGAMNKAAIVNVFIGNQCVLKNFNIATQWGTEYGPLERFFTYDTNSGKNAGFRLVTDIVVPPQADIKVTLQYGNDLSVYTAGSGTTPATQKIVCSLIGYGTLFNAGMSL